MLHAICLVPLQQQFSATVHADIDVQTHTIADQAPTNIQLFSKNRQFQGKLATVDCIMKKVVTAYVIRILRASIKPC